MCLAEVAKIKTRRGKKALVDLGGIAKEIKVTLTPDVKSGDYILLHAGFSIQKIDEKEAKEMKKLKKSLFSKHV